MNRLIEEAKIARQHAYAPYSKFFVGAALLLDDGKIIRGANVENCSYGLTICAERSAVCTAFALGVQELNIQAIAVVAESTQTVAPCGACRQVLAEFTDLKVPVYLHNLATAETVVVTLQELLPLAFSPHNLQQGKP